MSPKFGTRIKNWMEAHFGRSRKKHATRRSPCGCEGHCDCSITTPSCEYPAVVLTAAPLRPSHYRQLLTPDSCHSFSSPDSAYFTGQSEDSTTPITPVASNAVSKYFMLQNRDLLRGGAKTNGCSERIRSPLCDLDQNGRHCLISAERNDKMKISQRNNLTKCSDVSLKSASPRQRPRIKTNPWLNSSYRDDKPTFDKHVDDSRHSCSKIHHAYSSGRGSYISEASSGTLTKSAPENGSTFSIISKDSSAKRDSTYESFADINEMENSPQGISHSHQSIHHSHNGNINHGNSHKVKPPSRYAKGHNSDTTDYDEVPSDDYETGDSTTTRRTSESWSPYRRCREQRRRAEKRRSKLERKRRRGGLESSNYTANLVFQDSRVNKCTVDELIYSTPVVDPSDVRRESNSYFIESSNKNSNVINKDRRPNEYDNEKVRSSNYANENCNYANDVEESAQPEPSHGPYWNTSPYNRSWYCPSSEPLRRKVLRNSQSNPFSPRQIRARLPADIVRPGSALSPRIYTSRPGSAMSNASDYIQQRWDPTPASENLEQKIERLRRQRQLVESRIQEAQQEAEQLNLSDFATNRQERIRMLSQTLHQRRLLLKAMRQYHSTENTKTNFSPNVKKSLDRSQHLLRSVQQSLNQSLNPSVQQSLNQSLNPSIQPLNQPINSSGRYLPIQKSPTVIKKTNKTYFV